MDKSTGNHLNLKSLRFAVSSSEDVRRLSVTKVVTPLLFDALGHAIPGGLYDPVMGPYSAKSDPCATCGQRDKCPGHSGHIDLCTLLYNPVLVKTIYNVLRFACLSCYNLQVPEHLVNLLKLQLRLIDRGFVIEAQELELYKSQDAGCSKESEYMTATFDKYTKLLAEEDSSTKVYNTKNIESLRTAIVNTTLKAFGKNCIRCKAPMKSIKYSYKRLVMTVSKGDMQTFYETQNTDDVNRSKIKSTNKAILADECREYLRRMYEVNEELLPLLLPVLQHASTNLESPVDICFTDAIPVVPSPARPANKLHDQVVEHPQTTVYKNIINANATLRAIIIVMRIDDGTTVKPDIDANVLASYRGIFEQAPGGSPYEKMYNAWQELQTMIDQTWDKNMSTEKVGVGLKQIIEKKAGIIRMNMMGKRVNYACRTVITPDPYINVDEIGIPDHFAKKLSYPVPVTPWNLTDLRQMVRNGPLVHPGANYVQDENGQMQMIPAGNPTKRESMAKLLLNNAKQGVKTVHRHLQNGDVLLLNRQPSLHRPSIMAHKVRILQGEKTFRLHYSNCKSYNADFDGDEMNAHCPQSELARSEAYNLVNVSNQYLVPKDGTPLGGLIQDQVIAGVKISTRGRFFNREDYQHLVFAGLSHVRGDIKLLPPAIIKPVQLWSGKQIFSTIIINLTPKNVAAINLNSTAKIDEKQWQTQPAREPLAGGTPLAYREMSEAEVILRGGEVCVGVMDKTHYGATPFGLIHSMYELYGGNCATQLLTSLGKLFTIFLQREGFTLGVHDILVLKDADKKRTKIINKSRKIGDSAAANALGISEDTPSEEIHEKIQEAYTRDPNFRTILDRQYKSSLDGYTNSINKTCLPAGLLCKFPDNNLQLMVGSGAKGSTVNTMQISCLLGQIELEGKRPPLMISGKSLPSFSINETSPKSGGFIDGRFLTGIQPQDFFFHCMAGREGLIDTAVKTSRSGYLQRCLIKHLEGLNVNYDMTVRDSDNSVIQFMYGEDGMDIAKAPFFQPAHLAFLDANADTIVNAKLLKELRNDDETNERMLEHKKRIRHFNKKHAAQLSSGKKLRSSAFQKFSSEIGSELIVTNAEKRSKKTNRRNIDQELTKIWQAADADKKTEYSKKCPTCPDPVFSTFKPDNHFGSISEYFEKLIGAYVKKRPDRKHEFTNMMCVKSMRAFAAPGEPVGLLAAQSIGEPSTQMTLNTFHFAGRGEMNVTLGIPRLREILMMASANIKTPSMDIPFKPQARLAEKAENLRLKLVKVTVHDVLESIDISSSIVLRPTREKQYKLRFNFLPRDCYKEDFGVKPKRILKHMERQFFKLMFRALVKSAKAKNSLIDFEGETKKSKESAANFEDEDIDEREPTKTAAQAAGGDTSDDEAVNDEDDATAVRLKNRNADENDYEEPDVAEEINDAGIPSEDEDEGIELKGDEESEDEAATGEQSDVIKANTYAKNYVYDKAQHLWCELTFSLPMQYNKNIDLSTVLKKVAKQSIISQVPLINRAITYVRDDDIVLKTDGINIVEMFKHNELLDLNRLYTNHVHAMAHTYGIEAAARVIVKEVQNVFKVYGITVDPRHLLLIADYMTFDGTFKPLSRRGMESSSSPLQQMSFESSLKFLQDATISGRNENLESPSSRLMVGQPCKSGTGAFSLMNPTIVE